MRAKLLGRGLGGMAGMVMMALVVTPALAQSECTCTLPAATGPLGAISTASADVFVSGSAAAAGSPLSSGSVVTTGPAARASVDLGASCRFSMAGSMRMQIVPRQGQLCVQVIDSTLASVVAANGDPEAIASIAAGAGVVFSLGMLLAVSR